ncbi:MAG: aldehyde ferredoxin oxidoreductase family protein [Deltaproteobacteria bacterium]|nr:aldehyde ferredoxin oxidoreductase family protein [Deltaproteobacteria bacterium]
MEGWMGKILWVDLSKQSFQIKPLDKNIIRDFIGGRGSGVKILYDHLKKGTDPFSEKNLLIFATGPLTGTPVPMSGRFSAITLSPLTKTILDSNCGGNFGLQLKHAGFDMLVIEGKAKKIIYLAITPDNIKFENAEDLKGKTTIETRNIIEKKEKKKGSVVTIGPAGENKVRFASAENDGRFLGRGGIGAVMGSKNLKAIYAKGDKKIKVADPKSLEFFIYESRKWLKANPITSTGLPKFGTAVLMNIVHEAGILPINNFKSNQFASASDLSGEEVTEKLFIKKRACYRCPVACGRITKTSSKQGEGPEFETLWSLGALLGINDISWVAETGYLCNELGLDTISAGSTIACAMEMEEKGFISVGLKFGKKENIHKVLKDIAFRENIGNEMAEGSLLFSRKFGTGNESISVKGLELPAYDPRSAHGMALAYVTSNRGGCHLRAYMIAPELLGIPKKIDRFSDNGKAGLVAVMQDSAAASDSLIICRFASFAISDEYFSRLLSAVTGEDISTMNFRLIGERIFNLERLFNLREGFSFKDDNLPSRLILENLNKKRKINIDKMLNEYYRFRGWDDNGVPTSKKLEMLGLK